MNNSLLVEKIETFIKSVEPPRREIINPNLHPKIIVETVHRGGKTFQRHRRVMVRNWQPGQRFNLKEGEILVLRDLTDKYLVRFENGQFKGQQKYIPKQLGKKVVAASKPIDIPGKTEKPPKKLKEERKLEVADAKAHKKWEKDKLEDPKIGKFPPFVLASAAKRIYKLARKVPAINHLVNKEANLVKVLNGAHHPKHVKFNGVEGIFKGVGNMETGKFLPSRKNALTEVCAFEISRALRFNFCPPTITKVIGAEFGSVQQFVTGVEGIRIPIEERKKIFKSKLGRQMAIYDFVIGGRDRHDGNWMYNNTKKKIWAIDNGNSFPTKDLYFIHSGFINNFDGTLSKDEVRLIKQKKSKVLRYITSYFGAPEATSAAKRIDYMIRTGKMLSGWVDERKLG